MGTPGQIYFKWANYADLTAFGPAFYGFDEQLISAHIIEEEAAIPILNVVIKNRQDDIGFLAPGRKQWAWLSYNSGTTVRKLFFGRLVGIARDQASNKSILSFVAKAVNSEDQKRAIAASLRHLPEFAPEWYDEQQRDDPNKALEGYCVSWHVNRTTLEWSVSDNIVGEDGVEEFTGSGDIVAGSLVTDADQPPLTDYKVDAVVTYKQRYSGTLDIPTPIFISVTAESFLSAWPKSGTSLSEGYGVATALATDADGIGQAQSHEVGFKFENKSKEHVDGDTLTAEYHLTEPVKASSMMKFLASYEEQRTIGDPDTGQAPSLSTNASYNYVPTWVIPTLLILNYNAARDRTEHVTFNLHTNQQALFNDVASEQIENESFQGADVGQDLYKINSVTGARELIETMPIGDPSRRSFFAGARGILSLQNRILVGRAKVLLRSRAVRVTWKTTFLRAIELSCRKSALVHAPSLPGGQATGKITRYTIDLEGGSVSGTVTIGCCVGYGGAVTAAAGTPEWASPDFADNTFQFFSDNVELLPPGDIGFTVPSDAVNDDGLVFPLTLSQVQVFNGMTDDPPTAEDVVAVPQSSVTTPVAGQQLLTSDRPTQYAAMIMARIRAQQEIMDQLAKATASAKYRLELKSLLGSFEYAYDVETTDLECPQGINLEAP